ncbi:hypothetical protein CDL15_Pgr013445 [Punica granatum]|uniref:Uncharacterized protein n=1 Tax=Punica granatum TaxID=22663 RepID=A0A218W181_PUNGR|nr:hypothetical protein CDL15_Pgr013445 [Punica granatum]PKH61469.1 hypothetical protein CRG98_050276 [Punica granatum]
MNNSANQWPPTHTRLEILMARLARLRNPAMGVASLGVEPHAIPTMGVPSLRWLRGNYIALRHELTDLAQARSMSARPNLVLMWPDRACQLMRDRLCHRKRMLNGEVAVATTARR